MHRIVRFGMRAQGKGTLENLQRSFGGVFFPPKSACMVESWAMLVTGSITRYVRSEVSWHLLVIGILCSQPKVNITSSVISLPYNFTQVASQLTNQAMIHQVQR